MTPEARAVLADARHLLLVLAPLCAHLDASKRAGHLSAACLELARRIAREVEP